MRTQHQAEAADETADRAEPLSRRIVCQRRRCSVFILQSVWHYHGSLHCVDRHQWMTGPRAMTGRVLRAFGSQAVRMPAPGFCWPVGYAASCGGRSLKLTNVTYHKVRRASWHLSSMSGGIRGHITKMRSNSYVLRPDKLKILTSPSEILWRVTNCHDHLARDGMLPSDRPTINNGSQPPKTMYFPTQWSMSSLPKYPDVPRVLAAGLRAHPREFGDYLNLSWSCAGNATNAPIDLDLVGTLMRMAPIQEDIAR